jgi:hypothetical protein
VVLLGAAFASPGSWDSLAVWRWLTLGCIALPGLVAAKAHDWEWVKLYRVVDYTARYPIMMLFRVVHGASLLVLVAAEILGPRALPAAAVAAALGLVTGVIAAVFRDYYLGSHFRQAMARPVADDAAPSKTAAA